MSAAATALVLFEDDAVNGLTPLALTRPAFELRSGALCLRERLALAGRNAVLSARVRPLLRDLLALTLPDLAKPAMPGPQVWLNARLLATVDDLAALLALPAQPARALWLDGSVAVAWIPEATAALAAESAVPATLAALPPAGVEHAPALTLARYPWDLVHANGKLLCADFRALQGGAAAPRNIFGVRWQEEAAARAILSSDAYGSAEQAIRYPGVHVLEEANVRYGPGCQLKPGVVLDAQRGPILIGAGARLEPNVVVQGPAYIGAGTTVNPGARLREGTSVGACCKVGGELEESVVHDLSNKQHEGFLGHAALGSWVNLGADTNGSDLKNNYGTVKVDLGDGEIDTGQQFVGPTIGDHSKTGINTMLTTGAVIGVCSNVFGSGFPPRHVASFRWGGPEGWTEHRLEAAIATARMVLARRQAAWLPQHARLLEELHRATHAPR